MKNIQLSLFPKQTRLEEIMMQINTFRKESARKLSDSVTDRRQLKIEFYTPHFFGIL